MIMSLTFSRRIRPIYRSVRKDVEAVDGRVGETFSGVDYDTGLKAVDELKSLIPGGATMAQLALRWILMFDAVSCVIPGAKNPQQAEQNAKAAELPSLSESQMAKVREVYEKYIRAQVHARW